MHTILIVDDEHLDIIKSRLNNLGYKLYTANCIKSAINLVSKNKFDVAIIDIRIPQEAGSPYILEHGGNEIIRAIREKSKDTAIIVVTAYGTIPDAVETVKEYKVFDYVEKNHLFPDNLLDKIKKALDKEKKDDDSPYLWGKIGQRQIKVFLNDIYCIYFMHSSVWIETEHEKYITDFSTLKECEAEIKDDSFIKVRKGFIVNWNKVSQVLPQPNGTCYLIKPNGEKYPFIVSKRCAKELKKKLKF